MAANEANASLQTAKRAIFTLALVVVLGFVWLASRHGWLPFTATPRAPGVVTIYCFSTLDGLMNDAILPAFRKQWKRDHNQTIEFVATFAGSGDITERIIQKYPAQVAIVPSELDAYRIAQAGVAGWRPWDELPQQGVLGSTPLVIVVREGNPKEIRDFEDLAKPGIQIIHGDPVTSGGANLAILSEYASALRRTGDKDRAFQQLLGIWRNVTVRTPSIHEARARFEKGEGDALVTYEQDFLPTPSAARIKGEVVYPTRTLIAQPIVVRIDKNIESQERAVIEAFIQFLWSEEAQKRLVDHGFRSARQGLNAANPQFGRIAEPISLTTLGSPPEIQREILDGIWRDKVLPALGR